MPPVTSREDRDADPRALYSWRQQHIPGILMDLFSLLPLTMSASSDILNTISFLACVCCCVGVAVWRCGVLVLRSWSSTSCYRRLCPNVVTSLVKIDDCCTQHSQGHLVFHILCRAIHHGSNHRANAADRQDCESNVLKTKGERACRMLTSCAHGRCSTR